MGVGCWGTARALTADFDDPMDVVGHDAPCVDGGVGEMRWDGSPAVGGHFSRFAQNHPAFHHRAETWAAISHAHRDEIPPRAGIVVSG